MKIYFVVFAIFICVRSNSQVTDSLQEIEMARQFNDEMFGNVIGKAMPEFTAKDLKGRTYKNDDFKKAKVTFVNLWFASCAPCIAEISELNRLYDTMKHHSDVQFYAITWENESVAKEIIKKYDMHFPVLLVSQDIANRLNFGRGYPTNIILNHEGKVSCILSSGSLKPNPKLELYFRKKIDELLNNEKK